MPELPEVETVKRGLEKLVIGKTIKSVLITWPKSLSASRAEIDSFLIGAKIIAIRRRAKVLIVDLSTSYSLAIHLKMTGQIVFVDKISRFGAGHPNDSLVNQLPDRSTRVEFGLDNTSQLFFNDQRKFGWIRLIPTELVIDLAFSHSVGPEPLADDFLIDDFIKRLERRLNTNIKATLLDQSVVAGIGNIYADESLWGARIHPSTLVKNVPKSKLKILYSEIRQVMSLSIEKGGSTNRNYVNAEGKKGSYMDFARVFRREGQACSRCGDEIKKIRVAGRGTHICPKCQKLKIVK